MKRNVSFGLLANDYALLVGVGEFSIWCCQWIVHLCQSDLTAPALAHGSGIPCCRVPGSQGRAHCRRMYLALRRGQWQQPRRLRCFGRGWAHGPYPVTYWSKRPNPHKNEEIWPPAHCRFASLPYFQERSILINRVILKKKLII